MAIAEPSPASAKARSTPSATANGLPSGSLAATSTEPTRAVPNDEPRLDTLRDSPDMSPWSESGKLDCTTLTDAVIITPTPQPTSNSPGTKLTIPAFSLTSANISAIPSTVSTNPATIRDRGSRLLASPPAIAAVSRI